MRTLHHAFFPTAVEIFEVRFSEGFRHAGQENDQWDTENLRKHNTFAFFFDQEQN